MLWHDRGRKSVASVLVLFALPLPWPNILCSLSPFTEELFPAWEPTPVCDILCLKKKNHTSTYRRFFLKSVLFYDETAFSTWSVIPAHTLVQPLYTIECGYLIPNT